jgi:branched-chain amino acid transport system substrate-binding protein
MSLYAKAAIGAALLSLVCGASSAEEPYVINIAVGLTGGGAFLGKAQQKSLQLVEKAVNASGGIRGRPLQFSFRDDQTNPQVDVQLATEILAQKPAIFGTAALTAGCRAVAALVNDGPVDICFSPGIHPDPGSYIFTATVSTHDFETALVRYFRMRGWTRLALMFSTDASGQDAEEGLKQVLALPENRDVKAVEIAHFSTSDVSVSAQIERVKAADAQAFIAWSTGASIGTVFRGIIQAGLDIPIGTTDGNMTHAQMDQYASFLPKELYIAAAQWIVRDEKLLLPAVAEKHREFYKYLDEAGILVDLPTATAWDPGMLMAHALRSLGADATALQVRDFLIHLKGYAGINGIYDFEKVPQRGVDIEDAVVTRWSPQANTWQVVSKPTGAPLQ